MKPSRIGVVGLIAISILLFSARPALAVVIVTILDPEPPVFPFVPTTPLPPNPDFPTRAFFEFNLDESFKDLIGTASPNRLPDKVGFSEDPSFFALLFIAPRTDPQEIEESQTFSFRVTGDYWTVKSTLLFNPATAFILDPNDELTLSGFVIHNGMLSVPNTPHEGDDASGPQINYSVTVNAGNKLPRDIFGPSVGNGVAAFGEHPHTGHLDLVLGALSARVVSSSFLGIDFQDDITSWNGAVGGLHVVPEPSTVVLLGCGLLGLAEWRRRKRAASHENSDNSSMKRG